MRAKVALIAMVLVVIGSGFCGCIEQSGPVVPSANEIQGYSIGWEDGKVRGFTTGYVAYLREHNISEEYINYDVVTTPINERPQGYNRGEQDGYKSAWGYGYDAGMAKYEPWLWQGLGYIVEENSTPIDFYRAMGYDLTNILKEGSDQSKGITDDAKEAVSIAEVKSTGNKAQLIDSIAKESKRDCIYDVQVTGIGLLII